MPSAILLLHLVVKLRSLGVVLLSHDEAVSTFLEHFCQLLGLGQEMAMRRLDVLDKTLNYELPDHGLKG